jgi:hypothetical protein
MTRKPFTDNGLPIIQQTDRATVHRLSDGRMFAVTHAPHSMTAPKGAELVRTALNVLNSIDSVRRDALKDETLSDHGRNERVKPILATARSAMAEVHADLGKFADTVASLEKSVYAPPALDPSDAVGAMVDMELRTYVRGLRGPQRAKALDQLSKEPRLLEAVVRSPTNLGEFSHHGGDLWRARVETTHPQAASLLKQKEALTYAAEMLSHFDAAIG